MRLVTMILVALVLVACSACDQTERGEAKPTRASNQWNADGTYRLELRFDGDGLGGVVDEKTITMPTHNATRTIVEYFAVETHDWTWHLDVHQPVISMVPGIVIEGKVYPAKVVDANLDPRGFGVLPQNSDGSAITSPDIALWFHGPEFFADHPMSGNIVQTGPAVYYRTECKADGLLVVWDGKSHWFPK